MKRNAKGQFVKGYMFGINNPKWKGDSVGYWGLHTWVQRKLGTACLCVKCGSKKTVQWANISGLYKRNTSDWKQMCAKCHKDYDAKIKNIPLIRELYKDGFTQIEIAKKFDIHQSSVSLIINRKGAIRYV